MSGDIKSVIPMASVEVPEEAISDVADVLRSGKLRQGDRVAAFESAFAEAVGSRYAVAVSSGSAALHLAYLAAVPPGREVLVPAFSHVATASMVVVAGCVPVFCDVRPDTFTIDLQDAAGRITSRTAAIAPVHLFGNPCDIDGVNRLARRHYLTVIWDAAQAHGTRYQGKDVGQFSDLACYSFYPTKNMTTGEGGVITTSQTAVYERLRLLREHGQRQKYTHEIIGFNARMTEVEAVLGLHQLRRLARRNAIRRKNAAFLKRAIRSHPNLVPQREEQLGKSIWHLFTVKVRSGKAARERLRRHLSRQGIESAVHYPLPLHRQPALSPWANGELPVAERLTGEIFSLPVHPALSEEALRRIAAGLETAPT